MNESALLRRFFTIIKEKKPFIISTYNGDKFDLPFIEKRCEVNNISMEREIGIRADENGE